MEIIIEGHALSTPFGALKPHTIVARPVEEAPPGHALSTPFGALKLYQIARLEGLPLGHALSTPFGALKHPQSKPLRIRLSGACPLNALRGTETPGGLLPPGIRPTVGHALSTPFGALKLVKGDGIRQV